MKPLLKMRVYPEGKALYFLVNVWPTKKAMHKHVTWCRPPFQALCSGYTKLSIKNGKERVTPECGQLNFHKKAVGSAAVTHEFTHAVLVWARRVGIKPEHLFSGDDVQFVHPDEERFCHALDRMVGTFIDRGYKVGLW